MKIANIFGLFIMLGIYSYTITVETSTESKRDIIETISSKVVSSGIFINAREIS